MFLTFLHNAIRFSTVYLFGSTGETLTEKSGHLNLGIPGIMCFGAVGGCGALLSRCITASEVIAYPDLGAEAIRRLTVRDLPTVVIIDSLGNDLYELGKSSYLASLTT